MPKFILIGEAGSGKDTFANILPEYHRFAFGDEIALVCRNLRVNGVQAAYQQLVPMFNFNPPSDLLEKLTEFREIPRKGTKERKLKQAIGTYCRLWRDDIWTAPVREKVKKYDNVVITDCRRLSEFDMFPEFTSVYIDAALEVRLKRLKERDGYADVRDFDHPAEQEIRLLKHQCDYIVENNGTLEKLRKEIKEVLNV